MQIQTIVGKIQEQETQALVINLFEGVTEPAGATGAVDVALGGAIRALIAAGDFRGKRTEMAVLYPGGEFPARRVLLGGVGKAEKFTVESIRQAAQRWRARSVILVDAAAHPRSRRRHWRSETETH
jgi:leucyl aminopeptidase